MESSDETAAVLRNSKDKPHKQHTASSFHEYEEDIDASSSQDDLSEDLSETPTPTIGQGHFHGRKRNSSQPAPRATTGKLKIYSDDSDDSSSSSSTHSEDSEDMEKDLGKELRASTPESPRLTQYKIDHAKFVDDLERLNQQNKAKYPPREEEDPMSIYKPKYPPPVRDPDSSPETHPETHVPLLPRGWRRGFDRHVVPRRGPDPNSKLTVLYNPREDDHSGIPLAQQVAPSVRNFVPNRDKDAPLPETPMPLLLPPPMYVPVQKEFEPPTSSEDEGLSPNSKAQVKAAKKLSREEQAKAEKEFAARKKKWMDENINRFDLDRFKSRFKGWVELEADPDYFTIMLKKLGIEHAKVVEVHSLDDMLKHHHCLKYGIMFLSQYHDEELGEPKEEAPKSLWFSNQVVENACATVGILNIVNNVKTLDIGENLKSFKNFTKKFNSVLKGEALMGFDWCRNIHNAFARRNEMMAASLVLANNAKGSKASQRKASSKNDDNSANHYIAYVPFEGHLWKLDGLDMHPRKMGNLDGGEAWITDVRYDIERRMKAKDSSSGCTILAIVQDKLPSLIEMLGRSINYLTFIEWCITEKREYWKKTVATNPEDNEWEPGCEPIRGPDSRYSLTQAILDKKGVALTRKEKLDWSSRSEEWLTDERLNLVKENLHLRSIIPPLKEERDKQWVKYKDRVFDYGPVIHQWLKFLQENGKLDDLVDEHLKRKNGDAQAGPSNAQQDDDDDEDEEEDEEWEDYQDDGDEDDEGNEGDEGEPAGDYDGDDEE